MVKCSLGCEDSVPCWPFVYYVRNEIINILCCVFTYKTKADSLFANLLCCCYYWDEEHTTVTFIGILTYKRQPKAIKIFLLCVPLLNIPRNTGDGGGFKFSMLGIIHYRRFSDGGWRFTFLLLWMINKSTKKGFGIIPFFMYRNKVNLYKDIFITPFIHRHIQITGNGNNYFNIYPLLFWTKDLFYLIPIFFYRKESAHHLRIQIPLIFYYKRTNFAKKVHFLCIIRYRRNNDNGSVHFKIFPLYFYYRSSLEKSIVLFPIFYWWKDHDANNEVYSRGFISLLYAKYRDANEYFHYLFLIFIHFRREGQKDWKLCWIYSYYHRTLNHLPHIHLTYLFPIPIYINYEYNQTSTFKTIFPIYFRSYNDITKLEHKILFPIYGMIRRNGQVIRKMYALNLYGKLYYQNREAIDIAGAEENPDNYYQSGFDILWPLIQYESIPTIGYKSLRILPIYWKQQIPEWRLTLILPIYFSFEFDPVPNGNPLAGAPALDEVEFRQHKSLMILGSYYRRNREREKHTVAPLFILPPYYKKSHREFGNQNYRHLNRCWPFYCKFDKVRPNSSKIYRNHCWPLYSTEYEFHNANPEERYSSWTQLFFYIFFWIDTAHNQSRTFWILFIYFRKFTADQVNRSFFYLCHYRMGLFYYQSRPDRTVLRFYPFFYYKRDVNCAIFSVISLFHHSISLFRYSNDGNLIKWKLWPIFLYKRTNQRVLLFKFIYLCKRVALIFYDHNYDLWFILLLIRKSGLTYSFIWLFNKKFALVYRSRETNVFYIPILYYRNGRNKSYLWLFHRRFSIIESTETKFAIYPLIRVQWVNGEDSHLEYLSIFYLFSTDDGQVQPAFIYFGFVDKIIWIYLIIRFQNTLQRKISILWIYSNFEGTSQWAVYYYRENYRSHLLLIYKTNLERGELSLFWIFHKNLALYYRDRDNYYIPLIIYKGEEKTSLLWLFNRKWAIIYKSPDAFVIFPIIFIYYSPSKTKHLFLLIFFYISRDDGWKFRFLYRLILAKGRGGKTIRFEINPLLYYTDKRIMLLGGVLSITKRYIRLFYCVKCEK